MIVYFDTSAVVKLYFEEFYSGEVISLWNKTNYKVMSAVSYAETLSAIHRKKRESGLNETDVKRLVNAFKNDWAGIIRVEVGEKLDPIIEKLTESYSLRGFDAIHLASASIINTTIDENLIFACFDNNLSQAAKKEKLTLFNH